MDNNIIKRISGLFLIVILGYTQIGCQSEKVESGTQVVKDYNEETSNNENNNGNVYQSIDESNSNAKLHFIDTGNSDAILIIQDGKAALIDGGDNDIFLQLIRMLIILEV